jgi:hypothetical protein
MRALRIWIVVLVSIAAIEQMAAAEEKHAVHASAKNPRFDKIKALNGVWEVTSAPSEHGPMAGTVSYKVTAGGSAVLETLFGGSDHEMLTLYYVDGDNVALTHYCMLGNRPHMRAEPSSSPDKIVFKCREGENAAIEAEDHMHQVTFTFVDADHVKTEWVLYKGGKRDTTHSFDLARKKK